MTESLGRRQRVLCADWCLADHPYWLITRRESCYTMNLIAEKSSTERSETTVSIYDSALPLLSLDLDHLASKDEHVATWSISHFIAISEILS